MTLHPVLVPIPGNGPSVPPRERIRRQREAAARALNESARLSNLPALAWRRDDLGVPVFEQGVCWSLSHKPSWACGVVSTVLVGIDLEVEAPRNEGLWDYVASPEEQSRTPQRDWESFFRFWTAKEAVLKLHRAGLARLDACRVVEGPSPRGALLTFEGQRCRVAFYREGDMLAAVTGEDVPPEWHVLRSKA